MAQRKTRGTRDTGASPKRRGTGRQKKKKRNLLPFAAAAFLLLTVVLIGKATGGHSPSADGESGGRGVFLSDQPEFFSTVRPESMTVEIDAADDPAKAAAYFADSLFVGDTQMEYIQNAKLTHERAGEFLSEALFLTAKTYSWQALADEFNGGALTFNLYGEYVTLASALEKTNVQKAFLQIGRTDLAAGDVSVALQTAQSALLKLKQACPQTEIIVLSLTPNTAASTVVPGNNTIRFFNEGMYSFCLENGIRYADTAAAVSADGLPEEYCADPQADGIHLNSEGTMLWIEALLESLSAPQSTPAPTAAPTEAMKPNTDAAQDTGVPAESSETNAAMRQPKT